ncbi:MAG: glutamine--tRNA ligase/YqeY domain fusion protein [Sediminibacterium sp. Gen4]|jgi:glutaminyl-tRNA synthetase|uniref:glutamine--tRNA ligase/YqeY domain fusion protein n=1 Tax=unclassified Sediminibacterium TaxID=2635961 RepID=UPI0015C0A68E|nr:MULTISPECIES: glutamine--tRNA ligase/YqeY domain fusion protein [unclassified Sediminibacterium]MBW0161711.1 glutamine--tRNA ligase/YqeY domain fusion protein [Sediminibacterium sp.]MBW0163468.1 glutamine--tRNA ligase/YqeY domain fusion protein [Sediminibacterium sp.]NWK65806.1 glutamine--tRNA ligase/YqeY domain fusion protein [Sediminibacterium sp. Gen4]
MSEEKSLNFIEEIVEADLSSGKYQSIVTRFPPEPNGYLHIGHAKSICLNFGLANKYGGKTNLRFDDTNPVTEDTEYVESIKDDVRWLGFNWAEERYASDYFEQLYGFAIKLIEKGLAYVDDSTSEAIAQQKGTPTQAGTNSPFRDRSVAENLELFKAMRAGQFKDGEKVLRAKIDMAHPNMHMRDPIIYRIKHAHHHRTGDQWCIYPMYDFAHGQSDAIENITHSVCTLEFIPHRALYDWFIEQLEIFPSKQYEFARLNMTYTVMSKRKLLQLVNEKYVNGWDDPRMSTISGMRRRGYTAEAIREFCDRIGIAKRDNLIDVGLLEFCVREHLNKIAVRRMVVFDPLKVVLTNYEGEGEVLWSENNPEDATAGNREIPFSKELYIERDDFMEVAPKKYFRLAPGQMVRLKSAYIIRCDEVVKDANGIITELHCTYIPESKSGSDTSGINVKGTLHWVSARHAVKAEVRLYDRLFKVEDVGNAEGDFKDHINTDSLEIINNAYAEPALAADSSDNRYQFLRKGYFCLDKDSTTEKLVFNRTVTLKDTWAKEVKKG